MPVLPLDFGDIADRDVTDPDPGVLFDVGDVGQLGLDGLGARTAAVGARQRDRVQSPPATAGQASHGENH